MFLFLLRTPERLHIPQRKTETQKEKIAMKNVRSILFYTDSTIYSSCIVGTWYLDTTKRPIILG